MKLLVVEDDRAVAEMVRDGFASESHTVDISPDGGDGSFLAKSYNYDAIVLDYSLPKKDGLAVCREIRAAGKSTPIIFLSSTDDTDIKIAALESGADDYMTKPFVLNELAARVRAVTRRPAEIKSPTLTIADLTLDLNQNSAERGGKSIRLTRKEFNLLEYLMRRPGVIISRTAIMDHVWSADSSPFSNTVEAHIRNVRKKINGEGRPNLIINVVGRGYVMDEPRKLLRYATSEQIQ